MTSVCAGHRLTGAPAGIEPATHPYHGCALPTELGGQVIELQLDAYIVAHSHLLHSASQVSRRSRPTAQPGLGAAPPWRPARSQGSAPSSHPGLRVKMATGNETAKAPQTRRSPA